MLKLLTLLASIACTIAVSVTIPSSNSALLPQLKQFEVVAVSGHGLQFTTEGVMGAHPAGTTFAFTAFDRVFDVTLERNTGLFAARYTEERHAYEPNGTGKRMLNHPAERKRGLDASMMCHYKGQLSDGSPSMAAVSTCSGGFRGIISAFDELYVVEPAVHHYAPSELRAVVSTMQTATAAPRAADLHIVYRMRDYQTVGEARCGVGAEQHIPNGHPLMALMHQIKASQQQQPQGRAGEAHSGGDRFAPQAQQYVELMVVNDHTRFTQLELQTEQNTATMTNMLNTLYSNTVFNPPIAVQLVAQVTWVTADPFTYTFSMMNANQAVAQDLLDDFAAWHVSNVGTLPANDNHHLFSGRPFESPTVGLAYVTGMCQPQYSAAIVSVTHTEAFDFITQAHEMGHNFAMSHDGTVSGVFDATACTPAGFVMASSSNPGSPPTAFSTCSKAIVTQFFGGAGGGPPNCLLDVPTESWGMECGNGFVECDVMGNCEECDCLGNDCSSVDPCCNGATCMLQPASACSDVWDGCCQSCQPMAGTPVCRASTGPCDMVERCNGVSGKCPNDNVFGAGTLCTDPSYGPGLCFNGVCTSHTSACASMGSQYSACTSGGLQGDQSGGFCADLYCSEGGSGCVVFPIGGGAHQEVPDGVPCGSGTQCSNNLCAASSSLNPGYSWLAGNWTNTNCTSCDEQVSRNVSCVVNPQQLYAVNPALCTPSARPANTAQCNNPAIDCNESIFDFFRDPKNVAGVAIGIAAFVIVMACLCYCCRGRGDKDSRSRMNESQMT